MPPVLREGVQAPDGRALQDLPAEGHLHRAGQVVKHLLGQGLQGVVQIVDVVDVAVDVHVPPPGQRRKGRGRAGRGLAIGAQGRAEYAPLLHVVGGPDRAGDPGELAGDGVHQDPLGGAPGNQLLPLPDQKVPL